MELEPTIPPIPTGAGVSRKPDRSKTHDSARPDMRPEPLERPIGAAAPDVDPDNLSGRSPAETPAEGGRAPRYPERADDEASG